MLARIGAVLAALLASFVLTGAGQVDRPSGGPEDRQAAHAVAVLTGIEEGDAAASVPADFADVMGYRPVLAEDVDGTAHLVAPEGSCSTAFGATTYDFDRACKTHDYGYDLLRYAAHRGGELGPWARVAVDDLLEDDLRGRCDVIDGGPGCTALADVGTVIVKANSWRQGQGIPGAENPWPYVASAVLVLAAIAVPSVVRRTEQGDHVKIRAPRSGDHVKSDAATASETLT